MSAPAPNPPYQDSELEPPRVRLRIVLALLRVLAGGRGHASVRFWGGGFSYEISVRRRMPVRFLLDVDARVDDREQLERRLRAHLLENAP